MSFQSASALFDQFVHFCEERDRNGETLQGVKTQLRALANLLDDTYEDMPPLVDAPPLSTTTWQCERCGLEMVRPSECLPPACKICGTWTFKGKKASLQHVHFKCDKCAWTLVYNVADTTSSIPPTPCYRCAGTMQRVPNDK